MRTRHHDVLLSLTEPDSEDPGITILGLRSSLTFEPKPQGLSHDSCTPQTDCALCLQGRPQPPTRATPREAFKFHAAQSDVPPLTPRRSHAVLACITGFGCFGVPDDFEMPAHKPLEGQHDAIGMGCGDGGVRRHCLSLRFRCHSARD